MLIAIRRNVFETNSSSSHSIVLSTKGMKTHPTNVKEIDVRPYRDFGWEVATYYKRRIYGKLKEYTNSTIKLIEEVTESSKFQQQKIEKINQNINSINTQGVENMKMSQEALKVAVTTRELADAITKEAKTKKFNP
jgi:methyl-accepting chemotaxis protein